jgi:U3 small nucleolar RNA-associated protein 3
LKEDNEFNLESLNESAKQEDNEVSINDKKRKNESTKKIKKKKKKVKFEDEIDPDDYDQPISKAINSRIDNDEMNVDEKEGDKDEEEDKEFYSEEEQDEKEVLFVHKRDDVKKRRITRMIEKNKGLTPYRKRDYRNPRVRYKTKYKKAEIKRKSQVKEPVKEIKKYSGEYHGIKSSVVRSVRFK